MCICVLVGWLVGVLEQSLFEAMEHNIQDEDNAVSDG